MSCYQDHQIFFYRFCFDLPCLTTDRVGRYNTTGDLDSVRGFLSGQVSGIEENESEGHPLELGFH